MRRVMLLLGSVLVAVAAVTATAFATSLGIPASPTARDLPRIVTSSPLSAVATAAPAPSATAAAAPGAHSANSAHAATHSSSSKHRSATESSDDHDSHASEGGEGSDDDHEVVRPHLHESDGNEHSGSPEHSDRDR